MYLYTNFAISPITENQFTRLSMKRGTLYFKMLKIGRYSLLVF